MNKKFIWLIVSCLMVAALILASCAPAVVEKKEATVVTKEPEKKVEEVEVVEKKVGPQYGGTLTIGHSEEPLTWDMIEALWVTSAYLCFVQDPLVFGDWWADRNIFDYSTQDGYKFFPQLWVGALAESWEWPEPLTLIYHIRKGVRWQNKDPVNGREFVADDVVWHFNRILTHPKWQGHKLQMIESVTATDKYTVVFKWKEPYVEAMEITGFDDLTAHEVVDKYGSLKDWKTVVGTGPFILGDFVPQASATFVRNPDYWLKDPDGNQLPYLDVARVLIIADDFTRIAALRTGKIDLLTPHVQIAREQKNSLETTNPELIFGETAGGGRWYLAPKHTIEPFSDKRVRQALSMATPHEEIAKEFFGGDAVAFSWPIDPAWACFTPLEELPEHIREIYTYDPTKAKALLAEAGYPNGFKTVVQYHCAGGELGAYAEVMEALVGYWALAGVDLELKPVDAATAMSLRYEPYPYEEILGVAGGVGSPIGFVDGKFRTGASWNRGVMSDPVMDEMLAKASQEFDVEKRNEILKEMYIHLAEECNYIGFPQLLGFSSWKPWVKGYRGECNFGQGGHGPGGVMARIWLDQDLREEMTGR